MIACDGYTLLLTSTAFRFPTIEIKAVIADRLIRQRLAELGTVPIAGNANRLGAMLALETERRRKVVALSAKKE